MAAILAIIPAVDVTSWPRAGVVMLIILAVLLVITATLVNLFGRRRPAATPAEAPLAIAPSAPAAEIERDVEEDRELPVHDI